uniref:F-box protein 21 n=1 Tax=Sphenodon punctatus TaxID=8508 RepID=A0A8D0L964_SPHPU
MKYYSQADNISWLEEYKARYNAGLEARRIVASFSKRFFSEHVPCDGFSDIEMLGCPSHFFEDELMSILNMEGRKGLTWKYYAKKILYFLRQQNILKNLKAYLQHPEDQQSFLEGAVLIDQYCNPLSDISLKSVQAQVDDIADRVRKVLKAKNLRHPSLSSKAGEVLMVPEVELQRQVLDAMNCVLYEQLKYKGNEIDYYNSLNSYIHQVLIRRTGIPISLSVLYLTISRQLGVRLEPVNFPSHFLLRWCQGEEGSTDIFDYTYIDAFGKGKQLTVKECEYLIAFIKAYQRGVNVSFATSTNFDSCQLVLIHAALTPVLDILQHIQALDPSQHGAVGYLVQHTLEHIERRKEEVGPEVKHHSDEKHKDVFFSIGLIMKHKRYGYNCVIYGWDPTCMMGHEWIRNMNVHSLPHGDGSCRYAAQENLEYNLEPHEIPHPDIGRYFSEFSGTHYLANSELEVRYPEDLELTCATVQKNYSAGKE